MPQKASGELGGIDRHHVVGTDDRHDGDGDWRRTAGHDDDHADDRDRDGERDRNALRSLCTRSKCCKGGQARVPVLHGEP
jgi:hypothetical protein